MRVWDRTGIGYNTQCITHRVEVHHIMSTLDIRRHSENAPSWLPYHTAFLSQELGLLIPLHGTVLPFLTLSGCKCTAYTSTHINKSFIAATTAADLYNHTTGPAASEHFEQLAMFCMKSSYPSSRFICWSHM